MSHRTFSTALLFLGLFAACARHTPPTPEAEVLAYFPTVTLSDTTHLELPDEDVSGDTIPTPLFFKTLGALMQPVDYVVDSTSSTVIALQRFSLNERYDGCLVHLTQNWFKHQSILVFDKQTQRFSDRVTVGEWYGGEGGQVLIGSWLFDYNGDGNKDLISRSIQHSMTPTPEGEPVEKFFESAELLLWNKKNWQKTTVKDSAVLVKKYPIHSAW